jgi:ATP-dependent exoDNAse (exonuclease V) beta subunit
MPRHSKDLFDPAELETLWRRREATAAPPVLEAPTSDEPEPLEFPAAVGSLCHAVLARMNFKDPSLDVPGSDAVSREARSILEGFLATPAFEELRRANIVAREVPFVRGGTAGQIDLLIDRGAGLEIVDYKTDRDLDPAAYAAQAATYSAALDGAPFWLLSLRTGAWVKVELS